MDNICELPPEVLVQILSEVPLKDLSLVGNVCWKFRDIVQYVFYHNKDLTKLVNKLENWWLKYRGKVRDFYGAHIKLNDPEYGHENDTDYIDSNGVFKGYKPYYFPEFNQKLRPSYGGIVFLIDCRQGDILKFIRIKSTNTPITRVEISAGQTTIYERKTNNKELFIPTFKEGIPLVSLKFSVINVTILPQIPQEELEVIVRYILLPINIKEFVGQSNFHFRNFIVTGHMLGLLQTY